MLSLPCRSIPRVAAFVLALSVSVVLPSVTRADETIAVGNQAQVLVDDYVVESMTGLTRRLNLLVKHPSNPVAKKSVGAARTTSHR